MKVSTDTQKIKKKKITLKYQALSALAMLITWWVLYAILEKPYIIPCPLEVVKTIGNFMTDQSFYQTIIASLGRTLACVIISLVLGLVLAVISGHFFVMRAFLAPFIRFLRTIPTIVIIVYAIIWLSNNTAPIVITALITLPIVYANVLEGYDEIDPSLDEVFTVYQLSAKKRLQKLVWPSILPYIKASVIAVTSLGLKVMIASEVLSQTNPSIGKQFQMAKINLETEVVFAWAIVTLVISIFLEKVLKGLIYKVGEYNAE